MIGPPIKVTILEPLVEPPWEAASKRLTATLRADPTHLAALLPASTGHGSHCKSSRIEFNANSHSATGTKNRAKASWSGFYIGSVEFVNPSCS